MYYVNVSYYLCIMLMYHIAHVLLSSNISSLECHGIVRVNDVERLRGDVSGFHSQPQAILVDVRPIDDRHRPGRNEVDSQSRTRCKGNKSIRLYLYTKCHQPRELLSRKRCVFCRQSIVGRHSNTEVTNQMRCSILTSRAKLWPDRN